MAPTNLLYLNDFCSLTNEANVIEVFNENENDIIILNQTIFYPQGGGQPYDNGTIKSLTSEFAVTEVRIINDIVRHIGKFSTGHFHQNESVNCFVDRERRILNSRLHSAGHVVDMAVQLLGLNFIPEKGYHFTAGSYVEYSGSLEGLDKDKIKSDLEKLCTQLINEGRKTSVRFVHADELKSLCNFIPPHITNDKPVRLILFGDNFSVPCGGTHVANINEIRSMEIRKIKLEKGKIRVSYDIARN